MRRYYFRAYEFNRWKCFAGIQHVRRDLPHRSRPAVTESRCACNMRAGLTVVVVCYRCCRLLDPSRSVFVCLSLFLLVWSIFGLSEMDSASDSSEFEGFSEGEINSASDDRGPRRIGRVRETDSDLESDFEFDHDVSDIDSDEDFSDGSVSDVPQADFDFYLHDIEESGVFDYVEYVGPRHHLDDSSSVLDFYNLLFEPAFYEIIVTETNQYAEQRQNEINARDRYWVPTTVPEMKSFFAINILMGIHQLPEIDSYWSTDDRLGVPGVARVMPKRRFKKLCQYFHLSNNQEMPAHDSPDYDPLFKVRSLINMLSQTFKRRYKPHRELSIDEAMIAFKGRHFMKQYLPAKPTKWGFKVWTLADSHNGYVSSFDMYIGRRKNPGQFGLGYDVVMGLAQPYLYLKHHLYFDNFFTSLKLIQDLEAQQTFACATFRSNMKGMPQAIRNPGRLVQGGSVKMQLGNIVANVWHDKRDVRVISSNLNPVDGEVNRRAPRQTGQRPELRQVPCPKNIIFYNKFMGGVDLADQNRAYYPVGRESVKFWRYLVWYMVNTTIINALVIYKESCRPQTRERSRMTNLKFRLILSEELIAGFSSRIHRAGKRKSLDVVAIGNLQAHDLVRLDGRKRVCRNCSEVGRTTPAGRKIETSFACRTCHVPLCQSGCLVQYHERHRQVEL